MNIILRIIKGIFSEVEFVKKMFMGMLEARTEYMSGYISHMLRIVFINLLFLGVCMLVILSGLILIPFSLLFFSDWPVASKMTFGVGIGIFYILLGAGVAATIVKADRWKQQFKKAAE